MPIIIDNFQVNTNLPIDNRFVVGGTDSFYPNRDAIEHKYQGLRIWDLNVPGAGPYYWTGATWSSENAVGVSVDGTTSQGYLPVFTLGPTVLGKSLLFQNSTNQIGVGISNVTLINPNIDLNGSNIPTDIGGLHVNGNVKTNLYFIGKGDYIKQLNASNISFGLLDIARISNLQSSISGTPITPGSYVLFNTGSTNGVTWKSSDTISVLNATNTTNVGVVNDNSSTNYNITFAQASTLPVPIRINSKIQFKPITGQLYLSDGSVSNPVYTFLSSNTGFYHNYSSNGNINNNPVNGPAPLIPGIGTSIEGFEVTKTNRNGLIVNNRIYIQPTTSNLTDVGFGIVWLLGGATNDINQNDGFNYTGGTNYNTINGQFDLPILTTQRLNYYGIGSHIPDNRNTPSSLQGRGTYIAGYFGVDMFSGNRLKLKIDEYNDVSIFSRLNLYNTDILGSSTNANRVLFTMQNQGGSTGNNVVIKDWSVRANTGTDWLTWKHHNGITIDGYYNTPNGPDGGQLSTSGTLTFWERHPYMNEQYFGSYNRKTLTINSTVTSFVKVSGNIYNVTGNSFIGTYSVVSTKTIEDILNNNLPKTIKTGMFDINGISMYSTIPNSNGKFTYISVADTDYTDYTKWIEIPYNAPELSNVVNGQTSYIGINGSPEPLTSGRSTYDYYGTRNSLQQGWHNIKGYKIFQINRRDAVNSSRFKFVMYQDPAYVADFNSGKLTQWKLEKNATGVSVAYGSIGNAGRYNDLLICSSYYTIPSYFLNQPGISHIEIYIREPGGDTNGNYQDVALYVSLQRRSVYVPTTLNTNLPGVPLGSYTGI